MRAGLIPDFVTELGFVSRLVSRAHDTINVTSMEEEKRGSTFILKPYVLGFVALQLFLEVLMQSISLSVWDSSRCQMFSLFSLVCFIFMHV